VEYVDLFLLHYPACWPELCGADVIPAGRWQDSWKALETLVDKGLIRAIGKIKILSSYRTQGTRDSCSGSQQHACLVSFQMMRSPFWRTTPAQHWPLLHVSCLPKGGLNKGIAPFELSFDKQTADACCGAGVSNFDIDELAELLAMARIKPALVQRYSDPLSADLATQAFCRLAGVQYQV
jgi:diketogulonate reductase-like aldo/keto reductase